MTQLKIETVFVTALYIHWKLKVMVPIRSYSLLDDFSWVFYVYKTKNRMTREANIEKRFVFYC